MAMSVRSAKCRPPRSAPSAKERAVLTTILNLFARIRGCGYSSMILIIHCKFFIFPAGRRVAAVAGTVAAAGVAAAGGSGRGGPPPITRPCRRRGQPSAREHQKKKRERN